MYYDPVKYEICRISKDKLLIDEGFAILDKKEL